ncbi:MAG TPA: hypothetical protein DFK12_08505 [Gallionellaceae bacterium]|nr:hypothetical protein [Gallionellaceae bacterium]
MKNLIVHWRWLIPLLLCSADAHAWGLYTHVYFAQLLLWAVPLTDPRLRRAVAACPRLVLAGACLPDLSLIGGRLGADDLNETHRWERVHRLMASAQSDEEYALALGFASHLLADVIAHNHFVPAHAEMWANDSMAAHVAAEWAMDSHIGRQLYVTPAELLAQHRHELTAYVARHFACTPAAAWRSLRLLGGAESLLRASRLPQLCYRGGTLLDERLRQRFNHYLRETAGNLGNINRILSGEAPLWLADGLCMETTRARIGLCSPHQIRGRMPLPQDLFRLDGGPGVALLAAPGEAERG